ncbi:histidine kinase, partial [Priestia megaterium]
MSEEGFRRKTPEEILLSIQKMKKGHLKIILGTVSGSGKTYHMLEEGHTLKKRGIDVVIGIGSSLNHPKTIEQIGSLEIVPPIEWEKKEELNQDLDLDAIITRNPEVVLVDALSHRNRPGALHPTRLEDVKYLISKKISVITTLNIYELTGVSNIAGKLTGKTVKVNSCVPENTLAMADEVRLLDASPEVILTRIEDGSIEQRNEKREGREHLFRRDNLAVLRELALRFLAGEVNEQLDEYREQHGMIGPSGATEKILVTAQYHWNGSILIRRGQQIAKRLGGDLMVVCFQPPNKVLSKNEQTFKRSIIKLVRKIEAKFEELPIEGRSVADQIVQYATEHNITRIVMGQSKR